MTHEMIDFGWALILVGVVLTAAALAIYAILATSE
jgi:hypothetical protein